MARQPLRIVRGTAAQVANYTGPSGEFVQNADTRRTHVQDGATPGGNPMALLADVTALASRLIDLVDCGTLTYGKGVTAPQRSANAAAFKEAIRRATALGGALIRCPAAKYIEGELIGFDQEWGGSAVQICVDLNGSTYSTTAAWFYYSSAFKVINGVLSSPGHHAQGVVTAIGSGYFEFRASAGFAPTWGDANSASAVTYMRYDAARNAITAKVDVDESNRYTLTAQGGGIWRAATPVPAWMAVGDSVILLRQKYGASGITPWEPFRGGARSGLPLQVENVTFQGSCGMGVLAHGAINFTARGLRFEPLPGSWLACNADGIHLLGPRGKVVIADVTGTGLGDDLLNIHPQYALSVAQTAPDTFTATMEPSPQIGDRIQVLDANLVSQAVLSVKAVAGRTVTLASNLPAGFNATTWTIMNLSDLPDQVDVSGLYGTRINGRCFLIQARRVAVRNFGGRGLLGNLANIGFGTIGFPQEAGAGAEAVILDGFRVEDSGFLPDRLCGAAQINVASLNRQSSTAGTGPTQGIIIGKGEINRVGYGALSIVGGATTVDGLEMRSTGLLRTGAGITEAENDVSIQSGSHSLGKIIHKDGTGRLYVSTNARVRAEMDGLEGFTLTGPSAPVLNQRQRTNIASNPRMDSFTATSGVVPPNTLRAMASHFVMAGATGGAWSWSRQAFPLGQTAVPGSPRNFLRITETSPTTGPDGQVYQTLLYNLGDVDLLSGETVPVVFWLRTEKPGSRLFLRAEQIFGPGGSGDVYGNFSEIIEPTATWTPFVRTVKIPSVIGKTRGPGDTLRLAFLMDPTNVVTRAINLDIGPNAIGGGIAAIPAGQSVCRQDIILRGQIGLDVPPIPSGSTVSFTLPVPGAMLGDRTVEVGANIDLQGMTLAASVSGADTVRLTFDNNTGGTVDLPFGGYFVGVVRGLD